MSVQTQRRTAMVNKVFNATNNADLQSAYADWADTYDDDTSTTASFTCVELFMAHCTDKTVPVLDAGCGTGLGGEPFKKAQWVGSLTGFDLSQAMLDKAKQKGYHAELIQGALPTLPFSDNQFGGVFAAGLFTPNAAPPSSLAEFVRVTRPGGIIVFSMRDQVKHEFELEINSLVEKNCWECLALDQRPYVQGDHDEVVLGWYCVCKVSVKP
eukprot:TRINITY_DN93931_c0_g1_i1.p1 TRINITY_DN93931_c0_g1~~TRINITY_DN93931_c0_g1_i1.p1  ORF type:complete len:212 (-),score=6.74 TRINITY_DN93931_c0_g1_i1:61-696(-)